MGIVIPVAGILVSIQLATNSDSDDKTQPTNTSTSPPAATSGANPAPASNSTNSPAANQPAKVLAGPTKITLTPSAYYLDLDSPSPTPQPGDKGADAFVAFNLPDLTLGPPRSGDVVAIAPPEGPDPTRDDCGQAIAKRGTSSSGELAQPRRLAAGHPGAPDVLCLPTGRRLELPLPHRRADPGRSPGGSAADSGGGNYDDARNRGGRLHRGR